MALLALADLGHCEEDGAMSWPGSHANAVSVLPVGTDAEVQAEVRAAHPALTLPGQQVTKLVLCNIFLEPGTSGQPPRTSQASFAFLMPCCSWAASWLQA